MSSYIQNINDEVRINRRIPREDGFGRVLVKTANGDQWLPAEFENKTFTEPLHLVVHVDTRPFDDSVQTCTKQVDTLTGSVVYLKQEQIKTKKTGTEMICKTVSNGFLAMINQDINSQSLENQSKLSAFTSKLMQENKELQQLKERMTTDYNRFKSRYSKLFDDLNKELQTRIYNLMRPCFDFVRMATKEQRRLLDTSLLSTTLVGAKETSQARTKIVTAHVKENAANLIETSQSYIRDRHTLTRQIAAFQYDSDQAATYYLPVIVAEESGQNGNEQIRLIQNEATKDAGLSEQRIRQRLLSNDIIETPENDDERQRIDTYFSGLVRAYESQATEHRRIARQIEELYQKAVLKTYSVKY